MRYQSEMTSTVACILDRARERMSPSFKPVRVTAMKPPTSRGSVRTPNITIENVTAVGLGTLNNPNANKQEAW